jgi:glucose-6-phosphate isomerase
VFKAFIWDINPFDQFGVELGKTIADDLRKEVARKNVDRYHNFNDLDPITQFYLDTLFKGKL